MLGGEEELTERARVVDEEGARAGARGLLWEGRRGEDEEMGEGEGAEEE